MHVELNQPVSEFIDVDVRVVRIGSLPRVLIHSPERPYILPCLPLVPRADDVSTITESVVVGEKDGTGGGDSYGRLESVEPSSIVGGVGEVWGIVPTQVCCYIRRRQSSRIGGIHSPRGRYRSRIVVPSRDWNRLFEDERTLLGIHLILIFPPQASGDGGAQHQQHEKMSHSGHKPRLAAPLKTNPIHGLLRLP